jgi:hypothetical protein
MDFMDLMNKLSEKQRENAVLVATAAANAGVDPTLAIAIAYQESRLNLNPARGKDGEIGMMQVLPSTGKGIGFDEKALLDPQKNIEAGVEYLRRALIATGNNPKLAAAYYNGGPGAVETLKSGSAPDQRVINYVRTLDSFGTFANAPQSQPNPSASDQAAQASPDEQRPPAAEADDELVGTLEDMRREDLERSDLEAQERRQAQIYGGGAGAAFSAARGAGAAGGSLLRSVARSLEEGKQSAGAPSAAPGALGTSTAPARPTAPTAAAVPSVVRQGALPGQTGLRQPPPIPGLALTGNVVSPYAGHGSASANYGWKFGLPDIELENVRNMGSGEEGAQGAVKRQEAGMARARAAVPGSVIVERPSGILETISTGGKPKFTGTQLGPMPTDPSDPRNLFPFGSQPGDMWSRTPQQPQKAPTPITPPAPSTLERVSEGFRNMMRSTASGFAAAGRYVAPPLAIASAAGEGANIAQQFRRPSSSALDAPGQPMVVAGKERDYTSMGLSAGNILGGALSLFPRTSIPGIVLSAGTAAIQAYRDNPEAREFIVRKLQEASQTPFSDPMTGNIYP